MAQPTGMQPPGKRRPAPQVENLITCPKCEFVYDTRFLAECCRMVDGEGYHCANCDSLLIEV
jgi:hypothetical protein